MNLLLDTHSFIWFVDGDNRISEHAKDLIKDPDNACFISMASIWEMAIKLSLKKLEIKFEFEKINDFLASKDFQLLDISLDHTHRVRGLPFHHKDPFDRMIIAQALTKDFSIVTKDDHFKSYQVKTYW